jgi:hypothetical protein
LLPFDEEVVERIGMSTHTIEGEYKNHKYVARLRQQQGDWFIDSLVIGDLPREFDAEAAWPQLEAAVAAVTRMAQSYIDSADLHSQTTHHSGAVPLG